MHFSARLQILQPSDTNLSALVHNLSANIHTDPETIALTLTTRRHNNATVNKLSSQAGPY